MFHVPKSQYGNKQAKTSMYKPSLKKKVILNDNSVEIFLPPQQLLGVLVILVQNGQGATITRFKSGGLFEIIFLQ